MYTTYYSIRYSFNIVSKNTIIDSNDIEDIGNNIDNSDDNSDDDNSSVCSTFSKKSLE